MAEFMRVEDLKVYQKLCQLHIEVCELSRRWPPFERFELAAQARRSSNSAPANLAEKHSDRHVRNKIEGVNRSRGEALETVHHLFVAQMKGYITESVFQDFRERYLECVRMLNGMEKTLEGKLAPADRRWPTDTGATHIGPDMRRSSFTEPRTLNPEPSSEPYSLNSREDAAP
jgi:four helix bundle protein